MLKPRDRVAPDFTYEPSTQLTQKPGYWVIYSPHGRKPLQATCSSAASPRDHLAKIIAQIKAGANPDDYDFKGLNLRGADLRGMNLRILGANALRQIDFTDAKLGNQNFSGLNLLGANFTHADLTNANFEGARVERACFEEATLTGCSFLFANASSANMKKCTASLANFEGGFAGADFSESKITCCYFGEGSNFRGANLACADMTGAMLTYGAPSFANANLRGARLKGDFSGATFSGADMTGATLSGGTFDHATFTGANITGADLRDASLFVANIDDATYGPREDHEMKAPVKKREVTPAPQIVPLPHSPEQEMAAKRRVLAQFPVPGFAG